MLRRPGGVRRGVLVAAALAVGLIGAACEPLRNAPPGGGEVLTQTFRIGPFTLGPGQDAMGSPTSGIPRPAGAFGLKGARFNVVDASGTPVSPHDVHLHHIVLTTSARQDSLCPGRRERFIGAGMERTPISFGDPYAYLVGSADQWGAIYHVMNETPAGTPSKTVYIQYTLEYQPGATASNTRALTPLFQDVTGCSGGSTYDVPGDGGPGSVHVNTREWSVPSDGILVFTAGHLHDGGIDIRLRNVSTGDLLCKGVASYHENPRHLATINSCALHHRVEPGQRLRVAARYDNSSPLQDVMGIMLTYTWWGRQ